jgi:hypothetical protein
MPACMSIQDLHAHPSERNDLLLRRFKSHQTRLLLLLLLMLLTPPPPAAQEVLVTPKKNKIPLPRRLHLTPGPLITKLFHRFEASQSRHESITMIRLEFTSKDLEMDSRF